MNTRLSVLLLITVVSFGCNLRPKPKFTPGPSPTPAFAPPAQRSIAAERTFDDEAITFADLSLMVRTSTPEAEIMQHIARRGFLDPIGVNQAHSLLAINGSERLVTVVLDPQYVLSPEERQGYFARQQRRANAAHSGRVAGQRQQAAEFAERQKAMELQQQTYYIAAQNEAEKKRKEQAKLIYENRRKLLDQEIDLLQKRITNDRRYGYNENDLASANQRLKALQDERFNLKAP